MAGRAEYPILMNRHGADNAEPDSEDIWRSVCQAVKEAVERGGVDVAHIHGIGFDATCSLVVRGNKKSKSQCLLMVISVGTQLSG
jgi:ribulose kinase